MTREVRANYKSIQSAYELRTRTKRGKTKKTTAREDMKKTTVLKA